MRVRFLLLVVLSLLLAATTFDAALVRAQGADPLPQCVVTGRANGPAAEVQCREDGLKKAPAASPQIPEMVYRLAKLYATLGDTAESKAEEHYKRLVDQHCKTAPARCDEAKSWLKSIAKAPLQVLVTEPGFNSYLFAISPDGRTLVYPAIVDGQSALWRRDLASGKVAPIPGSENGRYRANVGSAPFWSPDGKSIGYFEDGKLRRIDAAGGTPVTLAEAPGGQGGAWGADDTILFVPSNPSGVYRVSATGGPEAQVVRPEPRHILVGPQFLPDGRHFLYYDIAGPEAWSGMMIGSLDSPEVKRLDPGVRVQAARFVSPNQLLFVTSGDGLLLAQQFDPRTFELTGPQVRVVDRIATLPGIFGVVALSVAAETGALAYRIDTAPRRQLVWFDRAGRRGANLGQPDRLLGNSPPRFAPDAKTVMISQDSRTNGAWGLSALLIDVRPLQPLQQGVVRSVPLGEGLGGFDLVWSPSSQEIAFSKMPRPTVGTILHRMPLQSPETRETVLPLGENVEVKFANDWFGDYLLYTKAVGGFVAGITDLLASPLQGGPSVPVATAASAGRFSPDGRWIAYERRESAELTEIYVQPFPGGEKDRRKVSTGGGRFPQWSANGRELYFLTADNRLMMAPVNPNMEIGKPAPLFPAPLPFGATYAPAPDGERFLVNLPLEAAPPIFVLSNWEHAAAVPAR